MFDYIIIGGGVVGTAMARELSKYDITIGLIEKESDVSLGASKANSGIVHGGYAGKYGTLKGDLCIKGNRMYDELNHELNFGFKRVGGLIIGFEGDEEVLKLQYENGLKVGEEMIWLDKNQVLALEPEINPHVSSAIHVPMIGITSPYEMTIALMENAIENGVKLLLNHKVLDIEFDNCYKINTSLGTVESRFVINAAGLYSDEIHKMLGGSGLKILPRRGQYVLFSKEENKLNHVIFQTPTDKGKGILVTPTLHGNLMIGPDAEDLFDEIETETSVERLESILRQGKKSVDFFNPKKAITTFSGIRAMSENKDFFIEYVSEHSITVGGIDSPGLTSAPAIACHVVEMIKEKQNLTLKKDFNPTRSSYFEIENDDLVCLCESQGKNRILACLEGPIEIKSTDAVKRRIRAGMGMCQGRRCEQKVRQIIADYHHVDQALITKRTEKTMPKRVGINDIRKLEI